MSAQFKKSIFIIPLLMLLSVAISFAETLEDDEYTSANNEVTGIEQLKLQMDAIQEEITRLRDEAEVRKKLVATNEEETENEKEILTAAGKDYSLAKEGSLGVNYGFSYAYNSIDILESIANPAVDHSATHNMTNSINLKYAVRNNLTISGALPFVYKNDQRSTSSEKSATDIGDLTIGALWQPSKSDGERPTVLVNGSILYPSGTSPYKIDVNNALSTGSGFYSFSAGSSISKSLDPVYVFGNLALNYSLPATKLSQTRSGPEGQYSVLRKAIPGYSLSASCGLAYALSYKVNLNSSISLSHSTKYKYEWRNGTQTSSGTSTSASLNVGTGWRISPRRSITTSLGIGLTNAASDFTLSFSIPFAYKL